MSFASHDLVGAVIGAVRSELEEGDDEEVMVVGHRGTSSTSWISFAKLAQDVMEKEEIGYTVTLDASTF